MACRTRIFVLSTVILLATQLNISKASVPTMESLFRNGNNQDVSGNFVIIKLTVNEETNEEKLNQLKMKGEAGELEGSVKAENASPRYFKFIFSLEKDNVIQLLQVEYKTQNMEDNEAIAMRYVPNLLTEVSSDRHVERPLLYSLIAMLGLNDSIPVSVVIKKYEPNFVLNRDVLNREKKDLLVRYKSYLAATKNDSQIKDKIPSPIAPEQEEDKQKVADVISQDMYYKSDKVKLSRVNNEFVWRLELDKLTATFSF